MLKKMRNESAVRVNGGLSDRAWSCISATGDVLGLVGSPAVAFGGAIGGVVLAPESGGTSLYAGGAVVTGAVVTFAASAHNVTNDANNCLHPQHDGARNERVEIHSNTVVTESPRGPIYNCATLSYDR